jgi:hypothetical protein
MRLWQDLVNGTVRQGEAALPQARPYARVGGRRGSTSRQSSELYGRPAQPVSHVSNIAGVRITRAANTSSSKTIEAGEYTARARVIRAYAPRSDVFIEHRE